MRAFFLAVLLAAVVVGMESSIDTSNSSEFELPSAKLITHEPLDIKFNMIESNRYFDIFKATTTENLSLSVNLDSFDVVKIDRRGVNDSLHRFDLIKRQFDLVPADSRYREKYGIIKHKDKFLTKTRSFTPMNNWARFFIEQVLPEEAGSFLGKKEGFQSKKKWYVLLDDKEIYKIIPFDSDNRALVFYGQNEPQVFISDYRGEILLVFKLAKVGAMQVATLRNGDFALVNRISKSQVEIYYGKNNSTLDKNYQFVLDMAEDKLRSCKVKLKEENFFSWPLFIKLVNLSHGQDEEKNTPRENQLINVPSAAALLARTDIILFKGLVLFHVKKYLIDCPWAWSMIDAARLFEVMPGYQATVLINFLNTVASYNDVEVDKFKLIIDERIILDNLFFEVKSTSDADNGSKNFLALSRIDKAKIFEIMPQFTELKEPEPEQQPEPEPEQQPEPEQGIVLINFLNAVASYNVGEIDQLIIDKRIILDNLFFEVNSTSKDANNGSKNVLALSVIDQAKLFEVMPRSTESKRQYKEAVLKNLLKAVASGDVDVIDKLITNERIILDPLFFEGKSISEHAGDRSKDVLALSLIDNAMWNIFSKPLLKEEFERLKNLNKIENEHFQKTENKIQPNQDLSPEKEEQIYGKNHVKITKLLEIFTTLGFDFDSSYGEIMDWELFADLIFSQEDNSLCIVKFKGTPINWIWKKYNENQSTRSKQLNEQRWKKIWPKIDIEKLFEHISNIFPDPLVQKRYTDQLISSTSKLKLPAEITNKLFNAVAKGNCRTINELVTTGVDLSIAKNNQDKTLSQYAIDNNQKFLDLLVEDSLIWQLLKGEYRRFEEPHTDVKEIIKNFSIPKISSPKVPKNKKNTKSSEKKKATTPRSKSKKIWELPFEKV